MLPGGGNVAAAFQASNARAVFEPPHSAAPNVRLFYIDRGFVPAADQELIVARFRILREPQTAAALGITTEQMQRLTSLPPPPPRGVLASPADLAELQRLWSAHCAAPKEGKAAATRAMLESLTRIAAAARQPTQAAYAKRAREIEAILAPQQMAAYREMNVTDP
jgi:hypothetical protein